MSSSFSSFPAPPLAGPLIPARGEGNQNSAATVALGGFCFRAWPPPQPVGRMASLLFFLLGRLPRCSAVFGRRKEREWPLFWGACSPKEPARRKESCPTRTSFFLRPHHPADFSTPRFRCCAVRAPPGQHHRTPRTLAVVLLGDEAVGKAGQEAPARQHQGPPSNPRAAPWPGRRRKLRSKAFAYQWPASRSSQRLGRLAGSRLSQSGFLPSQWPSSAGATGVKRLRAFEGWRRESCGANREIAIGW